VKEKKKEKKEKKEIREKDKHTVISPRMLKI
jgi:hypothetical protein